MNIYVPRPTVVVCGGLQTGLHPLLGSEDDGLRPRWLPHLSGMPDRFEDASPFTAGWTKLLSGDLLPQRDKARVWSPSPSARATFQRARSRWKRQARGEESASTSAALGKADIHLLRVALEVAEAEHPGLGGAVSADVVERAIVLVGFNLDCWRALPEQGALSLTLREEKLDRSVDKMTSWIEEHGGRADGRTLRRYSVGGVRTAAQFHEVIGRYEARFPGRVTREKPARGPMTTMVRAPARRRVSGPTVGADRLSEATSGAGEAATEFPPDRETVQTKTVSGADSSRADSLEPARQ